MPSDSVSTFLDRAQAHRLLNPDQVEQIVRQPDLSRMSLTELSNFLEQHRVLTQYQAEMVRQGRGEELHFAGYPVLEEVGPCPGGMAYRALHPSLRTAVILRRLRAEWFAPSDNAVAYVQRARAASTLTHPHLLPLLDAGVYRDEAYVVLEPPGDASDLDTLVRDIGPMPGILAVDYVRQAAAAVRVAHERGGWHGDIRPRNILVGPLLDTPKKDPTGRTIKRPGPASFVRVTELGLVPIRASVPAAPTDLDALSYLPPERLDAPAYSPRGDLYSLGATLFFLLTGRTPFPGATADEVMLRIRTAEPPPLEALRPDLAPALVSTVKQLLAKDPNLRPATAAELEARLAPFGRPEMPSPAPAPAPAAPLPAAVVVAMPAASSVFPTAQTVHTLPAGSESSNSYAGVAEWSDAAGGSAAGHSGAFSTSEAAAGPVARTISAKDKARTRMWLLLGALMHSLAVLGILYLCYINGVFGSTEESTPPPTTEPVKKEPIKKPVKKKPKPPMDDF